MLSNFNLTAWLVAIVTVGLIGYDLLAAACGWWTITAVVKRANLAAGWLPCLAWAALFIHFFGWQIVQLVKSILVH